MRGSAPDRSRRSDILAAAEREFAALGWAGGRVERIAADARVNKQLLFHYFDSKGGLFTAALRSVLDRHEPATASVATPVDELRAIAGAVESAARAVPGFLLAPDPAGPDGMPADAAGMLRDWRARQQTRVAMAVAEGQRRGHFRDDVDPQGIAEVAMALALGAGALGRTLDSGTWLVDHCAWR